MRKKKIFLADDSITIQKVVELTFSEGAYEVVCVGNGALAMQRVAEVNPDIALIDVVMPEKTGYEVCAHIKKNPELAWMPVLLLTGTFEPFDESRAREAKADGHFTKPFESRGLISRVNELLSARPRPGVVDDEPEEAKAPPPPPAATMRGAMQTAPAAARQTQPQRPGAAELFTRVPAGPAPKPPLPPAIAKEPLSRPAPAVSPAAPAPAPAAAAGSATGAMSQEALEQVAREAVAKVCEKVIREVAWEVIPDLAESIIRGRIRELEEKAAGRS